MPVATRHDRMVNAAVWLCEQGAHIGWGSVQDGKAVNRKWKSDATSDPALVPSLLHGARNSLVIAAGRMVILDLDREGALARLREAGLPETFMVSTPSGPDRLHIYGLAPEGYDVTRLPGTYADGEVRRSVSGEQSMVLGPWALRTDGEYHPMDDAPRRLTEFPESVLQYIIDHPAKKAPSPSATNGVDPDWVWTSDMGSRHDYLNGQSRAMRGYGVEGQAAFDALKGIMARHSIPVDDGHRVIDDEELWRMVRGADRKFAIDPPGVRLDLKPPKVAKPVSSFDTIVVSEAKYDPTADTYIVGDLIRPRSIGMLVSQTGLGKSYIRTELAIRLATKTGKLFDSYPIDKAVPVMLYDAENGPDEEWRREEAILDGLGMPRSHLSQFWRAHPYGYDLVTPEAQAALRAHLDEYKPGLCIFDTVGSFTRGKEWGDEMYGVLDFIRQCNRDFDMATLLVAHFRKTGRDNKGRTNEAGIDDVMGQWARFVDYVLTLAPVTDTPGRVRFETHKRIPKSVLHLERGVDGIWESVASAVTVRPPGEEVSLRQRSILEAIFNGRTDVITVGDWLKASGTVVSERTIFRDRNALLDRGLITATVEGVWSLTDEGRKSVSSVRLELGGASTTDTD